MIAGLLSAKSDYIRKEKMEKDIKRVDVRNLEIRATKPVRNSEREVLSARRPSKRNKPITRSRSATRKREIDEFSHTYIEDVFD